MLKGKMESLEESNKKNIPLYSIGIVAEKVGTTRQTLRLYENHGLIKPERRNKNKNRFYSENDIRWILCLRELIHYQKISIEGIKKLLDYAPCWKLTNCPEERRKNCLAFKDKARPCWELNKIICSNSSKIGKKKCEECIVFLSKIKQIKEIK